MLYIIFAVLPSFKDNVKTSHTQLFSKILSTIFQKSLPVSYLNDFAHSGYTTFSSTSTPTHSPTQLTPKTSVFPTNKDEIQTEFETNLHNYPLFEVLNRA